MYMSREREKMLQGQAQAADQQPWRCVTCSEAVEKGKPCRCVLEEVERYRNLPPEVQALERRMAAPKGWEERSPWAKSKRPKYPRQKPRTISVADRE